MILQSKTLSYLTSRVSLPKIISAIIRSSLVLMMILLLDKLISFVFPAKNAPNPSRSPLELLKCNKSKNKDVCGLLQLKQNADLDEMYGSTYGYYSSISPSMISHLQEKAKGLISFVQPKTVFKIQTEPRSRPRAANSNRGRGMACVARSFA